MLATANKPSTYKKQSTTPTYDSYFSGQTHGIALTVVPRPSPSLAFDRLQYANPDGKGLGELVRDVR